MLHQRHSIALGLVSVLVSSATLTACTSSNTASPTGTTGGSTGGTATAGTTTTAGQTTAGSSTGATATTTSSTTGTTAGATGDASAGSDASCQPGATILQCTGTAPTAALISNFSVPAGGDPTLPPVFGGYGTPLFGGTYVFPASDDCASTIPVGMRLTQDKSGGAWHITGEAATYAGFGLWVNCLIGTTGMNYANSCIVDASAYSGIQFTASGTMVGPATADGGPPGITFGVSTKSNTASAADSCGTCTGTCAATLVPAAVTATPKTFTYTWAQLGVTDPSSIVRLQWGLTDAPGIDYTTPPYLATMPYPVDLTIDDIQFTP